MKPLGSQDSEKLFLHRVFGSEHHCPDQLKEVSCRIVKECGGLPLAIITMAGLLASEKNNTDLWNELLQCFSPTLAILTLEEMLEKVVNLCYNSLPQYLKTCLLYLNIYPESSTIWKVDLLKQWIAEGFVCPTEGKEGVAESYFDELVNRGMIQPEKINHNDEVLSCTVHHSVRDLIRHKSSEEKFITAIDYSQTITGFHMQPRRLSLYFSCATYTSKPEGIRLSQVRSFAFFGLHRCMLSMMEFKHLRVLNLELWGDYDDCTTLNLSGLCRLFQLRYMKVSSHICVELPSQIQGLQFLETLEMDAEVSDIPIDIANLPRLYHLSFRDGTKLPDGIGRITSLQTLQYFDLGNNSEENVRSLGELTNLHDLRLTYSKASSNEHLKRNLVALSSSLGRLASLRSLTLAPGILSITPFGDHSYVIMSSVSIFLQRLELSSPICTFSIFPEWIAKLQKLRTLKIIVRVLLQNDIDILAELPVLTSLSLFVRRPTSESVVFHSGAFPVLKYFKYRCGAPCLVFKDKALPNLQRLKLGFNVHRGKQYADMISGIEHLFNLKEIALEIGAAAGAEESDSRAAEIAVKDAIHNHPRFHYFLNIKKVRWIEEEQMLRFPISEPGSRCKMAAPPPDGQEKVIAETQHIFRSFASSKKADDDLIRRILEWDAAVELIERWEAPGPADRLVFDSRENAEEYLAAAACLVGALGSREEAALQTAMARLAEEFRRLLICGAPPLAAEDQQALTDSSMDLDCSSSSHCGEGDDSVGAGVKMSFFGNEISPDLMSPDTIGTLRDIANVMLRAGYAPQLCHVYGEVRGDRLMEYLAVLGVDKMSLLEEQQLVEWEILEDKTKKWIKALTAVVRVRLPEERILCIHILEADANADQECFTKAAMGCVLHLLHFGDAIATGKRSGEKLFGILDMYEALEDVLPYLKHLFSGEAWNFIKEEAEGILVRLGDAVRGTIAEFSSAIHGKDFRSLMPGPAGELHPMTTYVMSYVRLLTDHSASLNNLLEYFDIGMNAGADNTNMTPLGRCMLMLITHLQDNIGQKSRHYEDEALQNIFLMNNLLYIVQKVKDSEMKTLLGDNWIRKSHGQIRQCSKGYLRSSWTRVLACLRDDGLLQTKGSSSGLKAAMKDRFKTFNLVLEELYRTQTSWMVNDPQLMEELKIAISEKVVPAYRSFVTRFRGELKEGKSSAKYIKYNPGDLEEMISHLFEGTEPFFDEGCSYQ